MVSKALNNFNIWKHVKQLIESFNVTYNSSLQNIGSFPTMNEIKVIKFLSTISMTTAKTQQFAGY